MYQRILVPVDGSATSNQGLDEAIKLARLTGARLRLINVVDELSFATGAAAGFSVYTVDVLESLRQAGQDILQAASQRVQQGQVGVESALFECFDRRVSDLIVDEASKWHADLIVLGTHGRRGVRRLVLGSDAEQILRSATVPVLLVRSVAPAAPAAPADPRANDAGKSAA